jgi:hypothetical protein
MNFTEESICLLADNVWNDIFTILDQHVYVKVRKGKVIPVFKNLKDIQVCQVVSGFDVWWS